MMTDCSVGYSYVTQTMVFIATDNNVVYANDCFLLTVVCITDVCMSVNVGDIRFTFLPSFTLFYMLPVFTSQALQATNTCPMATILFLSMYT